METATNPFNDFVFLNATPSERGAFTLATEKALAKLEKFQLPDPTFFILQWVQALVAAEAKTINITYSTTNFKGHFELALTFDGPGYTRLEIDTLYDHVFRSGRERSVDRLRELALGWLSACSLSVTQMILESNGRKRIRTISGSAVTEKTEATTSGMETGQSVSPFHRLQVCGKGNHLFGEILSRRCQEVPCEINFNGNLISSATGAAGVPWPNLSFQNGTTKGVMGATYGGSASSNVAFLRYGVEFVNRPEPALQPPVILRVSDPTLSKNVSQTDVVRDEAYEEFLARIRIEMKSMGLQLTTKRIPGYQRESLNRFIQSYLVNYIDVRVFRDKNRLRLMGEEFKNLIEFPLFRTAGGGYKSLAELQAQYTDRGYLLYAMDQRAQLIRWKGLLLLLEPEEVDVLKKYFSNLTHLSFEEAKQLSQGGLQQKLASARLRPIACSVRHALAQTTLAGKKSQRKKIDFKFEVNIQVPDIYPTGHAVIVKKGDSVGTTIPGVKATLIIETTYDLRNSQSDLAQIRQSLEDPIRLLLIELAAKLKHPDISRNRSRSRFAELACELLLFLVETQDINRLDSTSLEKLGKTICMAPILGLEDGSLVSLLDLKTYLNLTGAVHLGGAFVEGLESGALDPMPRAQELILRLLQPSEILSTDSIRASIAEQAELKFSIRRQTLMAGLGNNPNPKNALQNFAREAAAEAEEIARLEREYKAALEGTKLFVKPNEERLKKIAELAETEDFTPFDLGDTGQVSPQTDQTTLSAQSPTVVLGPLPLPSLEQDLKSLRQKLQDFCSAPGAVHVERKEDNMSFHLSTTWQQAQPGSVHLLTESGTQSLTHPLSLEGFIRLGPSCQDDPQEILHEAVEQLTLKALHTYRGEPKLASQRKRLQNWLLGCCQFLHHWQKTSPTIAQSLFELPLVPCRGGRTLSWKQLLAQAKRIGHTAVNDPSARNQEVDPVCDIITLTKEWRDSVLKSLGFPRTAIWRNIERSKDFDTLLKSAWKELTTVLCGQDESLISPDVIGKLSGEASFWTKWRSGFLSWDASNQRALVNPNHKLGKSLLKKYSQDPSWGAVLACALFSTINRGLEDVEDHHEKAFLEGLLDSLG